MQKETMSENIQFETQNAWNVKELSAEQIKSGLLREGLWPQYACRINNLERVQEELWKNYDLESNIEGKRQLLGDIANLQAIIYQCYITAKCILEENAKKGLK